MSGMAGFKQALCSTRGTLITALPGGFGAKRVFLWARRKINPWLEGAGMAALPCGMTRAKWAHKRDDISTLGKGTKISPAWEETPSCHHPKEGRANKRSPSRAGVIWESCQSAHSWGTSASHPPDGS